MTDICVKYLLMNDLVSNDEQSVRSLLDYSAENWANHFRDVISPEAGLVDWVWKLYEVMTERFRLWFPRFWTIAMPHHPHPKMKALHLAAFNGHPDILCRVDVAKAGDRIVCIGNEGNNTGREQEVSGFTRVARARARERVRLPRLSMSIGLRARA